MAAITIKNMPEELYLNIKKRAARNLRSINNEIIYCLRQAVIRSDTDPEKMLRQIDQLTANLNLPELTEEFLEQAKTSGRA